MGEILPPTADHKKCRDVIAVRRPPCRSVRATAVLVKCLTIRGSESLEKRIHQRWSSLKSKPSSSCIPDDNLLAVNVGNASRRKCAELHPITVCLSLRIGRLVCATAPGQEECNTTKKKKMSGKLHAWCVVG